MMEVDEADLVYEKLIANVARAAERTSFVKVKTEADFVIEMIVNEAQSLFRHLQIKVSTYVIHHSSTTIIPNQQSVFLQYAGIQLTGPVECRHAGQEEGEEGCGDGQTGHESPPRR